MNCHRAAPLSFLELPSEIRNQIYELVLRRRWPHKNRLAPAGLPGLCRSPRPRNQPRQQSRHTVYTTPAGGLLFTCSQVFREMAPLIYASHVIFLSTAPCDYGLPWWVFVPDVALAYFDVVIARSAAPVMLVPSPLELCTSLTICVNTPVSRRNYERWMHVMLLLQAGTPLLRRLKIKFSNDFYLKECPLGVSSRDLQLLHNNRESRHNHPPPARPGGHHNDAGCCVELAKDIPFAKAVAGFRGLDKLDVRGFYVQIWPKLLDDNVDRELGLHDVGLLHFIWDKTHAIRSSSNVIYVDYRRGPRRARMFAFEDGWSECSRHPPGHMLGPVEAYVREACMADVLDGHQSLD
ncbi:hypothetical protein MN608_11420 [Microdochium nivale]|nr:hypothetical protein MN608_11420 [Microdochium nivale]